MQYRELLDQLRTHVANLFQTHEDERFIYHNLHHTEQVVENVVRIANHYQLSDQDFFIVVAASWFHDMGYFFDCTQHESRGASLANDFLSANGVSSEVIEQVKGCIMATKMPQNPEGLLQQIVCDADLFHLGSDRFKERNRLMRKEAEAFIKYKIDKADWRIKTIALFKAHHYHTEFCQQLLNAKKAENLAELESKLIKEQNVDTTGVSKFDNSKDNESKEGKRKRTTDQSVVSKLCSGSPPLIISA
ncbi:HD domain-containing protein [Pedobacter steynii]